MQKKYLISLGQEDYKYVPNTGEVLIKSNEDEVIPGNYPDGQYFYFTNTRVVKQLNKKTPKPLNVSLDYKVYVGRDNIKFQYTHSADYESRVDPGATNIIDVFVLTRG